MKIGLLVYEGFVDFEITLLLLLLRDKGELYVISVDESVVTSHGRLRVHADRKIAAVAPREIDLLVIPGGEPRIYADRVDIQSFISLVNQNGIPIAAICGGPEFLSQAGIIKGRRITHGHDPEYASKIFSESIIVDEDVVIDGNIITAKGQAYAEFAVEVYGHLGFFGSEAEKDETLRWMKNIH
ncbi:MAG: DJ-1/PfpI family protein [Candidatus Thorarchaeota archaeon]